LTKTARLEIFDLTGGTQWSHTEVLEVMETGLVKWFNNAKGWGFIAGRDGSDIFVHYSHIAGDGYRTLREGQHVRYDLRRGPRGQFAENVEVNEELVRAVG
jgi:CspA family cold shock protein